MRTLSIEDCKEKINHLKTNYYAFNEVMTTEKRDAKQRVLDSIIATQYEAEIEAYKTIILYLSGNMLKKDFLRD